MIRRILVGLGDLAYAASATKTAIELAKLHDAELTGISVLDVERVGATGPVPLGGGQAAHDLRQHRLETARKVIEQVDDRFEEACREADIRFTVERPEGEPYGCVAKQARYHDVLVCGLAHLFEHGIVDEPPDELVRLVRSGVRPLITVTGEYRRIERVLVAYSGSMESAKAMKRFCQLRLWPNLTMRVVVFEHAHEDPEELASDAHNYCQIHGFEVDAECATGTAKQRLLPYAKDWDADLIVMGNSSRSLLSRRLFGETMLSTVQHTTLPLFLAQ